jgi:ankyrin repeat protein
MNGCTATTRAVVYAPLPVVKLLVDHGGIIISTDAVAQAVLGHNLGNLGPLEVVEYLLDMGAAIDTYLYVNSCKEVPSLITMYGLETPLQLATREGKQDMVELLLRRGADKKNKGRYFEGYGIKGGTALEIAEMKGFDDVAKLLRGD